MPTREVREGPVLDDDALQMLADHSCCGPAEDTEVAAQEALARQQGAVQLAGPEAGSLGSGALLSDRPVTPGTPLAAGALGEHDARAPAKQTQAKAGQRFSFRVRTVGFLAVAAFVLGTALLLVRPMNTGAQVADYTIEMSMSGFNPPSLIFPAGKQVTLKLVNKESPFHASGAEHQFAIDALGINEKVDARQTRVITIPAQQAGEYTFYCDVCCGGQKSPTMRGKVTFQ